MFKAISQYNTKYYKSTNYSKNITVFKKPDSSRAEHKTRNFNSENILCDYTNKIFFFFNKMYILYAVNRVNFNFISI